MVPLVVGFVFGLNTLFGFGFSRVGLLDRWTRLLRFVFNRFAMAAEG